MKLPKIPKGSKIDRIQITSKEIRVDISKIIDGVYVTGRTYLDTEDMLSCSDILKLEGWDTRLKAVIIHGGLIPFAKDMESFHLRVRRSGITLLVRFKNGGHMELDDRYSDLAWEHESFETAKLALPAGWESV